MGVRGAGVMILAVDVQYRDNTGFCAGVLFDAWTSGEAAATLVSSTPDVGEYVPGEFYKRELPCILNLLEHVHEPLEYIVIDGFVFLDGESRPGLGKHLYDALQGSIPVIGVAKSTFAGMDDSCKVFHGGSGRPLYVTAIGCAAEHARQAVAMMHGAYRLPTMLKAVDQLCRQAALDTAMADSKQE